MDDSTEKLSLATAHKPSAIVHLLRRAGTDTQNTINNVFLERLQDLWLRCLHKPDRGLAGLEIRIIHLHKLLFRPGVLQQVDGTIAIVPHSHQDDSVTSSTRVGRGRPKMPKLGCVLKILAKLKRKRETNLTFYLFPHPPLVSLLSLSV